jgi:UDP-N-acetylmuramoylalanine--D-glutamate ligase
MLEKFIGKRIAILGFGKEGQATFDYLSRHGVQISAILDQAAAPKFHVPEGARYVGGESYLDGLDEFDFIFRSPGFPRTHPRLSSFPNQENIYSHMKLFLDLCPCIVVAVTGTKGKTTTAALIDHIMKCAGKRTFLGGNIGQPPLNFVDAVSADDVVVLEISSFQSQDLHRSPHIGVILNVTQDHLDDGTFRPASHASLQEYLEAKANLIKHQSPKDFAILHPALGGLFTGSGQGKKVVFDPASAASYQTRLLGSHNLENISAAVAAMQVLGQTEDVIRKGVAGFPGVAQRLQLVAEKRGVKYYNDSASTNPDSTIAAISSFSQPVILIVGGSEKGLDYTELGQKIVNSPHVRGLVLVGQVAPKILSAISGFKGEIRDGAHNMEEIVRQADSIAASGDVVLLSPAAASFDMFENSKDRGVQFDREVNK